jgi:predicted GNAT superfamily acetyltransferase
MWYTMWYTITRIFHSEQRSTNDATRRDAGPIPSALVTSAAQDSAGAPVAASTDGITIRRVQSNDEYDACVRMQHAIWGEDFTEIVPATMLKVTQQIGGVTAGAFDASSRLLGFVFGMMGAIDGQLVHWSDMLAVHPDARNKGLGRRLKLFQRELLRPLGVDRMFWTYDPLVAKNAFLNIVRLGARPTEYVVDMYGADTHSALHGGIGTDRFVVAWDLTRDGGANARTSPDGDPDATGAPIANALAFGTTRGAGPVAELPDADVVRVEVPADIDSVIARDISTAATLRESTRRIFTHYMDRGYAITGFSHLTPDDRYFYILSRNTSR